ncbi:hypothetical protein R1flu_028264 [Riccia fluitans]|uniref:Uncharacterized protein n=1 Tax=Riccia fluitans TaxID=41844 RepID=A0ABD1XP16_9MARC
MAHSKKRTHRQSTEVFNFDPVAIAMEASEEVTRAAIDPIVPDSPQETTGDISPTTNPTQPADNARGVGPNNIQQEDEDLQLIPSNRIPSSVALGINFNYDRPTKTIRSNPSKKIEGRPLSKRRRGKDASTIVLDEAHQSDRPTAATDGSSLPSFENGVPLPPNARAKAPNLRKGKEKMAMQPER